MDADDIDLIKRIAGAPVELLERIAARYCSPSFRRDRRLAERDAAYRDLAAYRAESSGYATAKAICTEIERYRQGAWRFDRGRASPTDPRRALAHRILTLDDGRVRSRSTVERALAGIRSNSLPQMNSHRPHVADPDEPGGVDAGVAEGGRARGR